MARRVLRRAEGLVLATLAALAAGPTIAGDRALIDFIGYSPDGRYFAFEEYGVQDGSGFAYSSIYVVDLPADKWIGGSPFRAQAGDENADQPVAAIRAQARDKADNRLESLDITEPVDILVLLGDGVPGADGKTMTFASPGFGPPEDAAFEVGLTTFPAASPQDCVTLIGEKALGFALTYTADGATATVHDDGGNIPRSRGCPLDYRLYAVVEPFQDGGHRVAIVSSYPFGFEGPDRRFIAVPLGD